MSKKKDGKDGIDFFDEVLTYDIMNSKLKFIKTGILLFDAFLSGEKYVNSENTGIPVCKVVGLSGPNGVGKSTLILEICKRFNKQGYKVFHIDVENGLNVKSLKAYGLMEFAAYDPEIEHETDKDKIKEMKKKCLNDFLDGKKLFYTLSPKTYTSCMKTIKGIFENNRHGEIKLIVIDSIKDIIPTSIYNNDDNIESQQMMIDAKSQEFFLLGLKAYLQSKECCIIIINQFRVKSYGAFYVDTESGGNGWLHRTDIRMIMKEFEKIKSKKINNLGETVEKQTGNWVQIEMKKGRFGNAFTKLVLPLIFGKGVSMLLLYARCLEQKGYIKKSGSWYTFSLPEIGIEDLKYQGETGSLKAIKENFEAIEKFINDNNLLTVEGELEE